MKGIKAIGGTLLVLRQIVPLRAFNVAVFSHGWEINRLFHKEKKPSVPENFGSRSAGMYPACSSHPPSVASVSVLIALFCTLPFW